MCWKVLLSHRVWFRKTDASQLLKRQLSVSIATSSFVDSFFSKGTEDSGKKTLQGADKKIYIFNEKINT